MGVVLYFWGCVGKPEEYWGYPLEFEEGLLRQKKEEGVACGTFLLVLDSSKG